MTSATTLAEEVSNTLLKALPRASDVVDHYREHAIWDQAIIETLAIIAKTEKPEIPANVADEVRGLFGRKEISPQFERVAEGYLARIGTC
jgi:hypothetical protein